MRTDHLQIASASNKRAIEEFEHHASQMQIQVHQKLAVFGDKMVERAMRKGKCTYQFKIGDEVQILRDLNNTKKSLSKKPKFASPFLPSRATITEILANNTFRLEMIDGSTLPHNRTTFTSSMFKIWKKNPNPPVRQQITVRDILLSEVDGPAINGEETNREENRPQVDLIEELRTANENPSALNTDDNSSALNARIPHQGLQKRSLFTQLTRLEEDAKNSAAPRQQRQRKRRADNAFV